MIIMFFFVFFFSKERSVKDIAYSREMKGIRKNEKNGSEER